MNIDKNTPAFPSDNFGQKAQPVMPLAAYAAIHLRVPESGIDWLDAMIEKARKDQLAGMALQGLLCGYAENSMTIRQSVGTANEAADAMLAASKTAVEEPEWIPWPGGECPTERDDSGSIRQRDGKETHNVLFKYFDWYHDHADKGGEIIAYRIGGKP